MIATLLSQQEKHLLQQKTFVLNFKAVKIFRHVWFSIQHTVHNAHKARLTPCHSLW